MQPAAPDARLPRFATPFIGRRGEIAQLADLLNREDCHLLTLTGPGGSGKTRLAIEVARQMTFEDGAYFVPLQPLGDFEGIVTAIVDALPLQLTDSTELRPRLLNYLHDRHLLLILDNFEHLLDGVNLVTDILAAAAHVKLLVTSRERLNLQAEHLWPVHGLDVPRDATDTIGAHSAVQLFLERAQRVQPDFSWDSRGDAVIHICQLVEGLPLALELAASWVRALPCETIADEIQRNLDMLTSSHRDLPKRHRSMRAVFDQSWKLLAEAERSAFCRLTVFRGGFTADAAQQVAGVSLRTLASLIDKSLVRLDDSGRHNMHELLRQYGDEQFEAADAGENTRNTHSTYFADYVHRRVADLKGRRQIEAMAEINADFDNVRAAWNRAADHHLGDMIEQMIDGLGIFCDIQGRKADGYALFRYAAQRFAPDQDEESQRLWGRLLARSATGENAQMWLETALQIAENDHNLAEMAFCLAELGRNAWTNRETGEGKHLLEQSLSIYRELGDRYAMGHILGHLLGPTDGTWEEFQAYGEEAFHLCSQIGDRIQAAWVIAAVALSEGRMGHFVKAESLWLERINLGQEIGNLYMIGGGYAQLCNKVYLFQGNFTRALAAAEEALRIGRILDHASFIGWAQATQGLVACVSGDYSQGVRLCQQGASTSWMPETGGLAAFGLAIASCGLEDYEAASAQIAQAHYYLTKMLGQVGNIACLPIHAIILAHREQSLRAAELLALAFTHPVGASGWMERWPLLDRLRTDLEQTLSSQTYSEAWQRGTQLDLETTVTQLNAQSRATRSSQEIANRALAEPLTERELEVLACIGQGLTNREIADQLYVGVSTVKKHLNHIFGKLGVKNRTSAVACARELKLLH